MPLDDEQLPSLPEPDKQGRIPALEYVRVSLARDLIGYRRAGGVVPQQLADLAGTREEKILRIKSGNYTASSKLVERIDRAIQAAMKTAKAVARKRRPQSPRKVQRGQRSSKMQTKTELAKVEGRRCRSSVRSA